MASTTLGVKVDDLLRSRLKDAATRLERTPHWLIKQAIFAYLEKIEHGQLPAELSGSHGAVDLDSVNGASDEDSASHPFLEFAQSVQPQSVLRAAITAAYRRPEPECVPFLLGQARLPANLAADVQKMAAKLVETLRSKSKGGGVEGLIHEFSLSSQEGVALMCLAEALLRIPDRATRDALIRDKISKGDWRSHVGHAPSLFVNAATWGLMITGKLVTTNSETGLSSALTRMIGKGGEPLIRKGVDMAMRLMGEQFVTGENISEALANSRKYEARGFRYSYDMLGEAATTEADAQRYYASYEQAIHAIFGAVNQVFQLGDVVVSEQRAGPGVQGGPPVAVAAGRWAVQTEVEHQRDQLRLARHVPVERHLGHAELVGDALHGDRREAVGVGDRDARAGDVGQREGRARAAPGSGRRAPQQLVHRRHLKGLPGTETVSIVNCIRETQIGWCA